MDWAAKGETCDSMTPEQELLSGLAKTTYRLNAQFLGIGEQLARPAGLTAALWQVLAAVLRSPLSVADISREIGTTRQSVQRIADILVEEGLAGYLPNPAHRRAKLLNPTDEGRAAMRRLGPAHAAFAQRLADEMTMDGMRDVSDALTRLSMALDSLVGTRREPPSPSLE